MKAEEFDRKFDDGEDIAEYLDRSNIVRPKQKIRAAKDAKTDVRERWEAAATKIAAADDEAMAPWSGFGNKDDDLLRW